MPTDWATTMGCLVSRAQLDKVHGLHASRRLDEGARLVTGRQANRATRRSPTGIFVEPTVFADVTPTMRIAREEIFGPVLVGPQVERRGRDVRGTSTRVEYGLTLDLDARPRAPRIARRGASRRATSGSTTPARISSARRSAATSSRASGARRAIDELFEFTQTKNVNVKLDG